MILKRYPIEKRKISLKGAVQINRNSYFVLRDAQGKTFINTGHDEKIQKYLVKNMIKLNPRITRLLKKYRIKQMSLFLCLEEKNERNHR